MLQRYKLDLPSGKMVSRLVRWDYYVSNCKRLDDGSWVSKATAVAFVQGLGSDPLWDYSPDQPLRLYMFLRP